VNQIKTTQKRDFSKITGRFHTRLSLSSSNTDEVIHQRLLLKKAQAEQELKSLYGSKGDILKHQLTFTSDCATLKSFRNADDFSLNYPFGPHQFQLLQTIFESIRKAGATGLHLSRGERSMLDSFQSAAKAISANGIGALVPIYEFYPAI